MSKPTCTKCGNPLPPISIHNGRDVCWLCYSRGGSEKHRAKRIIERREYHRLLMRKQRGSDEPWPKRRCEHCSDWFQPDRSTARFCSDKCRVYASRGAAKPRKRTWHYYRSGLSVRDIQAAMDGKGWLTLTQIVGLIGPLSPEATARNHGARSAIGTRIGQRILAENAPKGKAGRHKKGSLVNGSSTIQFSRHGSNSGTKAVLAAKLAQFVKRGRIQKKGSGMDAKYRWTP